MHATPPYQPNNLLLEQNSGLLVAKMGNISLIGIGVILMLGGLFVLLAAYQLLPAAWNVISDSLGQGIGFTLVGFGMAVTLIQPCLTIISSVASHSKKTALRQSNNTNEDRDPTTRPIIQEPVKKPCVPEPPKKVIPTKDQILEHLPRQRYISIAIGAVDKSTNAKEKCKFNYYSKDKNGTLSKNPELTYEAGIDHMDELLESGHTDISKQELVECLINSGYSPISLTALTKILS